MTNEAQETYVSNAAISATVGYSPAMAETATGSASPSGMETEDAERAAAERRAKDLAEWLEKVRQGDPSVWRETPPGISLNRHNSEDHGVSLQANSLTPAQERAPHSIIVHQREFATDAEYQSYVDEKKAWARKHCPSGVEIVPVVTAEGRKTVAVIGLSPEQANAINDAVREKTTLERQITLNQEQKNIHGLPVTPYPVPEDLVLDPATIKAKADGIAAEMKILPKGTNVEAVETEAEVISSVPHSPEMQKALQQAMEPSTATTSTDSPLLTVIHRKMPKSTTLGRTA